VRRRRALAATIAALLCATALPGIAASAEIRDPNDTPGWLEVRRVITWGREQRPAWRILTGPRWTARRLWDKGFLVLMLDTFGDARLDYHVVIASNGRGLEATLWRRRRRAPDRRLRRVDVWRPNRRNVVVRFRLGRVVVGPRRDHYRWFVETLLTARRCRRVCIDRVPNRGTVKHQLASQPR
jgi:hypothetical protein